jgi:hypothetical protein
MKNQHKGPHKYQKFKRGAKIYWKCALPTCTHYIEDILARGKETICHGCLTPMLLVGLAVRREKPICEDCKEKKYGERRYDLVNRKYKKDYTKDPGHEEAVKTLTQLMELDIAKD